MLTACLWVNLSPAWASTAHIDGAAAIAYLNQQRAANGIPLVEDNQTLATAWCPNEDSGPSGGEDARDLSGDLVWSASESPWDNAPLHQFTIYNPEFLQAGSADVSGSACMGLGDIAPLPAVPTFYAYLSDTGPAAVPYVETVYGEGPLAPQQTIGIPQGKPTGPNLLLYARGFPGQQYSQDVNPINWSLTTSSGQSVPDVKMADTDTFLAYGLQGGFDDGADMIPPLLQPRTQYQGSVLWQGPDGSTATQTFAFTTGEGSPNNDLTMTVERFNDDRSAVLNVDSAVPNDTVTIRGDGKTLTPHIKDAQVLLLHLSPGHWTACATSGGWPTGYATATRCLQFRILPRSRKKRLAR